MISGYIKIKIGCFNVVFCRKRNINNTKKSKKRAQNDARADDKQGFFFTRLSIATFVSIVFFFKRIKWSKIGELLARETKI